MAKKRLLNPRGYLSWTQIDMWLRSKNNYCKKYFENVEGFENDAMRFGKITSNALEHEDDENDDVMQAVISLLPAYEGREHEIKAKLDTPYGEVTLLGKLDTWKPKAFREYKTGIVPWTQRKAEKHKQILHYATLMYMTEKVVPKAHLDWIQTEWIWSEYIDEEGFADTCQKLEFTGHMESFEVNVTLQSILEYMALVSKVAKEIDEEYRRRLKELT